MTRRLRIVSVVGLLLVLALQLFHVVRATSATWDEPHHLFDGYAILTRHDYRLNPEVPPLIKMVAALPLLDRSLQAPVNQDRHNQEEAFRDGREFVFSNGESRTLEPARLACMSFTLLLALLIYLFAGELFGYSAALFVLALFVFDPNFLAHGALVTTDVGSACGFLAAIYTFYRYCKRPTWPRLLLAAFAAGILLGIKFTGIFLLPILFLTVLAEWALRRDPKLLLRRLRALIVIGACAWVLLWSFYGFRYKAGANGAELNPSLPVYLERMYDQKDAKHLATLAKYKLLPEAYIWGLENTKQTEFEDTSYFWGKVYRHGNWEYFPVAFLVKSTLPFLILTCLGIAAAWWVRRERAWELLVLLVPVAFYMAVSMHSDMNIGVRHLFPVYALLYVAIASVAAVLLHRDRRFAYLLGALLVWQVFTSVRVSPAYMAYGNEAWGGPGKVNRYLGDANTDWAQQLKDVKLYLAAHPAKNCWFAYFADGAIEPSDYGIDCKRLPTTSTLWWLDRPMMVPPIIEGTVFISDSDLEGIEFGDGPLNPYDSFKTIKPTAVIDHGLYVYDGTFEVPLASALYDTREARKALMKRDIDQAYRLAHTAVESAPQSVPVQETMGDVLMAEGNKAGALEHWQMALSSAEKVRRDLQEDSVLELKAKISSTQ